MFIVNKGFKWVSIIALAISCIFANVELVISYDFGQDVTGFQFDVNGVEIVENSSSGGAAGEYFDIVQSNTTTVIGISFSNTPIPAGAGALTTLMVTGDIANATISNVVLTDINEQALASTVNGLTISASCVDTDLDDCGVCFGGNADQDCSGECFGTALVDDCGVCDGDGIAEGTCDCAGNIEDYCGICGGGNIAIDCSEEAGNRDGSVFITELTDPQNSSDAGRYVELYNNGDADVDLSSWILQRWTNGNADPSTPMSLTGTISAGGFYVVCNNADKFNTTYGLTCDQDVGTGGVADSNGDDNIALIDDSGSIVDMFGVAGEDGSGTGHEFEDGRAERAAGVTAGNPIWDESEWNIDNDSGGGDGNQYAPEGFDPFSWIGASGVPTCDDATACNYGEEGGCSYTADCAGECGGSASEDCAGTCNGDAVVDACGECGGDGTSCSTSVTFSVDMNVEGVTGDIKMRTSTINGDYSPSEWYTMNDGGDNVYTLTLALVAGNEYGYNFNNSDGSGYESGDGLTGCAGGNYGNDRFLTVGDDDLVLDTVCWESCEACPDVIPGCTDDTALNYDSSATEDDGSCFYVWPELANLFFSEYAEGSSNNKYLEIYNGSDGDVDLSGYSISTCSNGCDDGVSWDYPNNVTFEAGSIVLAGDVYVVCHGSADATISAECDQEFTYLSNGDDVQALTQIGSGAILDIIGEIGDDPGSGWAVAGVSNATKDHTLVRVASVDSGNSGYWEESAGDADNSEWIVLDQNTWAYLGTHPHNFASLCDDDVACNYAEEGDCNYAEAGYDCDGNPLLNITFHVNMTEQVVDTEGYGLDLNINGEYHDMADEDGDDVYTTTLILTANTEYTYKFINGSEWEVDFNDLGCGAGDNYGNRIFTTSDIDMAVGPFCFNSCLDCETAVECGSGDTNGDGDLNVSDIVQVVNYILGTSELTNDEFCRSDITGDNVVNVTDIVNMVSIILGNGMVSNSYAPSINLIESNTGIDLSANGIIGGIQLTILHDKNANIRLSENVYFANFNTDNNKTTMVLIYPEEGELFTIDSDFKILNMVASDLNGEIDINLIKDYQLLSNYPNPFNPVTTISYVNKTDGYISINVYDLNGRLINNLVSEFKQVGNYQINWVGDDFNGSQVTSGVYFLTLETNNSIVTNKITLLR